MPHHHKGAAAVATKRDERERRKTNKCLWSSQVEIGCINIDPSHIDWTHLWVISICVILKFQFSIFLSFVSKAHFENTHTLTHTHFDFCIHELCLSTCKWNSFLCCCTFAAAFAMMFLPHSCLKSTRPTEQKLKAIVTCLLLELNWNWKSLRQQQPQCCMAAASWKSIPIPVPTSHSGYLCAPYS